MILRRYTTILLLGRIFELIIVFIRLGLNIALTHQNRSYRDSETKENVEANFEMVRMKDNPFPLIT